MWLVKHWTPNLEVVDSFLARKREYYKNTYSIVTITVGIAQLVERWTSVPEAVGSIPAANFSLYSSVVERLSRSCFNVIGRE